MKCKYLFSALLTYLTFSSLLLHGQTMTSDPISTTVSNFTLTGEYNPVTGAPFYTAFFILFGDGQFASGEGQSITRVHKYPAGYSGNARAWFAKKKDSSPPPMLTTPVVFGATPDAFANPASNMPNNVKLSTAWIPVAGQQHFAILTITNKCPINAQDGVIKFYFNAPQITFDPGSFADFNSAAGPITVTPTTPSPNLNFNQVGTWSYSNLLPGEQRHFFLFLNVGANVMAGASIPYKAVITQSKLCGQNPLSNISDLTVNSGTFPHDPNLKFVDKGNICSNSSAELLEYHIIFHNDGNGSADDVWVFDDLDANKLDINSFSITSSSHPCQLLPNPLGANNAIIEFPGIKLPGLNQLHPYQYAYSETCGELFFKIKTHPNLSPGVIHNYANIQFDGLPKVETNIADVFIYDKNGNGLCLGRSRSDDNWQNSVPPGLAASPNPFSDYLTISPAIALGESALLEIVNLSGKVISSQTLFNDAALALETADWPVGIYFIRLQSSQAFQVQRVIKQ